MVGPKVIVLSIVLVASMSGPAQLAVAPVAAGRADELVQQLRQFPASLPAGAPSDGRLDAMEERRRRLYDELRALGSASLPGMVRGLADRDARIRRNVALSLGAAAGTWYKPAEPRLDIQPCLPALIAATEDPDARVRELAAQAIGAIGPDASSAVPALIHLLAFADEGSRNCACIGLTGIGPGARAALTALRRALSDPSADVRRFAQRAISTIDTP